MVLQLCRDLGIRDLHYVSTAYVCGSREGTIREDELDVGQTFRNDYEHSKFLAEKQVREAEFLDQLTVYRPAVVAGDSRTGYTSTYHGLYLYLKLMALLVKRYEPGPDGVRRVSMRVNQTGEERRNVVPVDWVSAVICRLYQTPAAHGGTYHLAPHQQLTSFELVKFAGTFFNAVGIEFCGKDGIDQRSHNWLEKLAYENIAVYQSYELTDPCFDTSNLSRFASDLPCPPIDEETMHRYIRYGELDRWGKRRAPRSRGPRECERVLRRWVGARSLATLPDRGQLRRIGLDIYGPGGGHWTLLVDGNRIQSLEVGLAPDCSAIYSVSQDELDELCSAPASGRRAGSSTAGLNGHRLHGVPTASG
jgi:hypothetical protein